MRARENATQGQGWLKQLLREKERIRERSTGQNLGSTACGAELPKRSFVLRIALGKRFNALDSDKFGHF